MGPLVAGALLVFLSWRGILFIYIVPALLMAFMVWLFLQNIGKGGPQQRRSLKGQLVSALPLLKNRIILGLAVVALLRGMVLNSQFIWTPFYLKDEIGMGTVGVGIHIALLTGMGVVSTPILGAMSDRFNRKYILAPGFAFSAVLTALIVNVGGGIGLTAVLAATGLFSFALHQIIQASVLDQVSEGTEATAIGFLFGASSVVGAFSPLIAVAIIGSFGLDKVFYYQAGLTTIALVILMFIPLRKRLISEAKVT